MAFCWKSVHSILPATILVACLSVLCHVPEARASERYPVVEVKINRAKVMRVSRPASMIIIGNPAIADATIRDSQTLIITGKQYGTTNLIVLDAEGEPIADEVLSVASATDDQVIVYKGAARQTFSCSPDCEPIFRVGDDAKLQEALRSQIDQQNGMVEAANEAPPQMQ